MYYGKYDNDEPSLAQKIAKELSKKNDNDEVRLTASYCNSGDTDDYSHSHKEDKSPKNKSFSKLKVGDYIKGLEHFGPIVAITDSNTPVKSQDTFSEKKIKKMRKWLDKKGFSYEGEYKSQHSYWLDSISLSVVIDPQFIIIRTEYSESEDIISSWKLVKSKIKEIISISGV